MGICFLLPTLQSWNLERDPLHTAVFHLVFSNGCWCFYHSCLYLIMKGGTIRPPHSMLSHSAPLLWMLHWRCFSWCCLKALSMSVGPTIINQFYCMTLTFFSWQCISYLAPALWNTKSSFYSSAKTHKHRHYYILLNQNDVMFAPNFGHNNVL